MSEAKRPHRATGKKPPGGARPGAGRKPGATNALPYGAIKAVRAVNLRVPEGAPPEVAELANRALQRVVDVMEGRVKVDSGGVLKAATLLREEVCGPVAQKLSVGGEGEPISIQIIRTTAASENS